MSFKNESSSDRLKRHIHDLSILNRIAEALNREVGLNQSLNVALSEVAELFDLRTGCRLEIAATYFWGRPRYARIPDGTRNRSFATAGTG